MPVTSPDRLQQFGAVVADAVLEHDLDLFDIADLRRGVATDNDQIRILPRSDRSDAIGQPEIGRAIQRPDPDRFDW